MIIHKNKLYLKVPICLWRKIKRLSFLLSSWRKPMRVQHTKLQQQAISFFIVYSFSTAGILAAEKHDKVIFNIPFNCVLNRNVK